MQGIWRRVVYISLYEVLAIALAGLGLMLMSGESLLASGALATATSAVAVVWNLVFNSLFERWEARQPVKGRSVKRRVAHAVIFEAGLVLMLVPLIAWWLNISLWKAFMMEAVLLAFFPIFAFIYNWAFDSIFGLPDSVGVSASQS